MCGRRCRRVRCGVVEVPLPFSSLPVSLSFLLSLNLVPATGPRALPPVSAGCRSNDRCVSTRSSAAEDRVGTCPSFSNFSLVLLCRCLTFLLSRPYQQLFRGYFPPCTREPCRFKRERVFLLPKTTLSPVFVIDVFWRFVPRKYTKRMYSHSCVSSRRMERESIASRSRLFLSVSSFTRSASFTPLSFTLSRACFTPHDHPLTYFSLPTPLR